MKKRILAALVASAAVLSLAGCNTDSNSGSNAGNSNSSSSNSNSGDSSSDNGGASTPDDGDFVVDKKNPQLIDTGVKLSESEGKVLTIYAWNDEFQKIFQKYYKVPDGITVNWVINPSADGVYQQKLDDALLNQDKAAADDKIDIFLAEADYILKYVDSDYTKNVADIGFSNASTIYNYTAEACTDSNGVQKGMSFQCCPAGLIYRRSIAKEVIGSDDPAVVQEALSSWDKFDEVASKAKDLGYYMTPSFAETYRTFSNNVTSPWVDADGNVSVDPQIKAWIKQTKDYMDKGYTLEAGIWDDEKNAHMFKDGKAMCFFGPAWYYNFSMGNVKDQKKDADGNVVDETYGERNTVGDWGLCVGPQSYFWGGTWLLAGAQTDNPELVKDIFNAFQSNEKILKQMVEIDSQFVNNTAVNDSYTSNPDFGNDILGGQNDWAIFADGAKNIQLKYSTGYDQLLNEKLQDNLKDYFKGTVDLDTAWGNYVKTINEAYAELKLPEKLTLD